MVLMTRNWHGVKQFIKLSYYYYYLIKVFQARKKNALIIYNYSPLMLHY